MVNKILMFYIIMGFRKNFGKVGKAINNRHNLKSFAQGQEIASDILTTSGDPRAQAVARGLDTTAAMTRVGASHARRRNRKNKK
jgi:hypothetical protein